MSTKPKKKLSVDIKTDLVFGEIMYIKLDPKQEPHELLEYKMTPDGLKFKIANMTSCGWFHDFQLSLEPDTVKQLKSREQGDDDDD